MEEYCRDNYHDFQPMQFNYKDWIAGNDETGYVHTWIIRDKSHLTYVFAKIVAKVIEDDDCLFDITHIEYEMCFKNLVDTFFSYVKNSMASYANMYVSSPKKYLYRISMNTGKIGNSLFLQNNSPVNSSITNNIYTAYFVK